MNDKDLETILSDDYPIDDEDIDNDKNEQNSVSSSKNNVEQPSLKYSMYSGPLEPCQGMEFEELEDAHTCYNSYARRHGFGIRKNHTRLSQKDDRSLIGVEYVCTREGFRHKKYKKRRRVNPEPAETRIGCKTRMYLKRGNDKWVVSSFVTDHNHELLTPKSVPPRKIMSVLTKESGGDWNAGCVPMDAPTTIITDDCPSMKNAIAQYGLEENGWMKYLYMRREKWVPAFLRTTFCAGMSTTQRSESMNKFFKDYVRSSTLVSDFVHQYDKALNAHYQNEKEKNVKTKSSKAILKTCYKMEANAAKHYTRKMFYKFQDELFSSQNYRASKDRDEGEKKIYKVIPHGKERPIHEVSLDISDNKTICTCLKFEFVGILCRHILAIFVKKSLVNSLPKCFILERWTIDAKRHTVPDIAGVDVIQADTQISSTLMRNSLMMQFLEVAENGSKSRRKYEHLSHSLQRIHEEILAISDENEENLEASVPIPNFEATNLDESNIVMTLQDPLHVRSRGRPKSLRAKNPKENQSRPSGIKRKCTMCKAKGHNKTTCPSLKPSLTAGILLSSAVGVKQNSSSISILQLSYVVNVSNFK
ncbi:hypothetical protein COLO4_19755 [Corchorus olitorius]|uniref:Protein FAR1-RELATED SEQUENCE n=1 Tax=Corchorus olitorius TaxID=93759 RepID=A0A1R3J3R7_9ROSI|nr:hypothetical protein COLO4_19755 [Corchorus olitorius]